MKNNRVMKIIEVKDRTSKIINELLEVWEDSVKKTHLFLSDKEIKHIKEYALQALAKVSHLIIIEDKNNVPIAFMGIEDKKLEMSFIKNSERGKSVGKHLLNYEIKNYKINELTVNEKNPKAKEFYEHMGFKVYKRELD